MIEIKQLLMLLICFSLIMFALGYTHETEIMAEQMKVLDNYSIALDSDTNFGKLKLELYIYPIDEDVALKIYNPSSEVIIEEVVHVGSPIDDVFYFDAVKGTWLVDLSVENSDLSYQIRFTEMYMSGIKDQSVYWYYILVMSICLIFSAILFSIRQYTRIRQLKKSINEEHDIDMYIERCNQLRASCFAKRIRNIYTMNIARGHLYKGDYLSAKQIMESIPLDSHGEVMLLKNWIKRYYVVYIYILLDIHKIAEAEELINKKRNLLNSPTKHISDMLFMPYLETVLIMEKGEYAHAIDRLLALQSLAKRDEDKAEVYYSLSKSHYKLGNLVKAREYLEKSKGFVHFEGLETKLSNLENQLENIGINYEV